MLGKKTGGRTKGSLNKATADIKAIAQQYTPEAVGTLVSIMANSVSDAARVAAAKELLDRGHGKSIQQLEATVTTIPMAIETPAKPKDATEWANQLARPN